MELRSLKLFVDVARRGSFAAVARENGVDASSVSRMIALLEDELGLRLFQRSTRKMELTEAGELYLHRVEGLVDELEGARDQALALSAAPAGQLRLTCSVSFGLTWIVPLLGEFRAEFPQLGVDLVLSDANLDLVAERIDLAIRLAPSVDADLIGTKLSGTHYRVCVGPAYLHNAGVPQTPAELGAHQCLLFPFPDYRRRWLFKDAQGVVSAVPVEGHCIISSAIGLRDAARAGLGLALLPNWLTARDIEAGTLVDVFPRWRMTATTFETAAWLLYPSRSYVPGKVRAAIDFLRRHLGRRWERLDA